MRIRSIHVRRFRSIASSSLTNCGGLNVLIGKNNAGKSSFLRSIELILEHLAAGMLTRPWPIPRLREEFTDRDTTKQIQVGIEFDLPAALAGQLSNELKEAAPHLARAIEDLRNQPTISFVLATDYAPQRPFTYLQQVGVGLIAFDAESLAIVGVNLLQVPSDVAAQLHDVNVNISEINRDIAAVEEILRRLGEGTREYPIRFLIAEAERTLGSGSGQLERYFSGAKDSDELQKRATVFIQDQREKRVALERKQTDGAMMAFAGPTKICSTS